MGAKLPYGNRVYHVLVRAAGTGGQMGNLASNHQKKVPYSVFHRISCHKMSQLFFWWVGAKLPCGNRVYYVLVNTAETGG